MMASKQVGEANPSSAKPSDLDDRLQELQDKYDKLRSGKEKAEKEFCTQRAKLKELFLSREDELKRERGISKSIKDDAARVKAELENFRKAAELSETEREEEVRSLRKQYQEEAASMQKVMEEAVDEVRRATLAECQKLLKTNQELEQQIKELQPGQTEGADNLLASITHVLKKPSSPGITPTDPKKDSSRTLEDSMVKAQEDAEVLRSIVMPLEQEICSLKSKLRDAQEKVKLLESQNRAANEAEAEKFKITIEDQTKDLSTEELRDKVKELQHYLESERSSRTDLEMYVAVLNTQKGVLQEDADKLRKELHNVCRLLEQEKQAHRELKETWQQVYEQFLDAQDAQTAELEQIKKLLTADQIEQLKNDRVIDSPKKVKPDLPRPSSAEPSVGQLIPIPSLDMATASTDSSADISLLDSSNPSLSSMDSFSLSSIMSVPCINSPQVTYSASQEVTDVVLSSSGKTPVRRVQSLSEISDPEKGLLSDGRTQSDNDLTSSLKSEGGLDVTDSVAESLRPTSLRSKIDWTSFQNEVKYSSQEQLTTQGCAMCTNYEQQLQKVQKEKQALQELAAKLQNTVNKDKKVKELLAEERYVRSDLEQGIAQATEEAQAQINGHVNTQLSLEKLVKGLQENFEAAKHEAQEQINKLKEAKDQLSKELRLLQDEYGKLQEHALKQMTNDESREDFRVVEMREQLQQVQAAQDNTEDKLRSEIMFLKDRVMAEQFAKENMEETLQMEIESTKEELAKAKAEFENELKDRGEVSDSGTNQAVKSVQVKSKQVIVALQTQLEESDLGKKHLEAESQQLKNQLQSLQEQLNNSEAVQRDFVRLSQSLQMQIAQIQESQSEVRWQHEDDSNQCKKCQKQLVMARDKHHCRHCGRIFCDDCTSNTVESHVAKKPLKVCEECFAMLRKDANTSYFNVHLADEKT